MCSFCGSGLSFFTNTHLKYNFQKVEISFDSIWASTVRFPPPYPPRFPQPETWFFTLMGYGLAVHFFLDRKINLRIRRVVRNFVPKLCFWHDLIASKFTDLFLSKLYRKGHPHKIAICSTWTTYNPRRKDRFPAFIRHCYWYPKDTLHLQATRRPGSHPR